MYKHIKEYKNKCKLPKLYTIYKNKLNILRIN